MNKECFNPPLKSIKLPITEIDAKTEPIIYFTESSFKRAVEIIVKDILDERFKNE